MTNLAIEILVLTVVLVNFGAILTANIYDSSKRALQRRKLFCGNTLSNPYCIIQRLSCEVMQGIADNRYIIAKSKIS